MPWALAVNTPWGKDIDTSTTRGKRKKQKERARSKGSVGPKNCLVPEKHPPEKKKKKKWRLGPLPLRGDEPGEGADSEERHYRKKEEKEGAKKIGWPGEGGRGTNMACAAAGRSRAVEAEGGEGGTGIKPANELGKPSHEKRVKNTRVSQRSKEKKGGG